MGGFVLITRKTAEERFQNASKPNWCENLNIQRKLLAHLSAYLYEKCGLLHSSKQESWPNIAENELR